MDLLSIPKSKKCWINIGVLGCFICFIITLITVTENNALRRPVTVTSHSYAEFSQQEDMSCPTLCLEEDSSSIFFLEITKRQNLSLREICAIESATLHNPKRPVIMYSMAPLNMSITTMKTVFKKYNAFNKVLNVTDVFQGTPLETWYKTGIINQSSYKTYHLSDALRLAVLWKYGGAYLDTDVITLCPLNCLPNALGLQLTESVASGVLFFQKEHPFLYNCMQEFARDYHGSEWAHQGPSLVTKILKKTCNVTTLAPVVNKPELCQGIRLVPEQQFIPIPWNKWQKIFKENYAQFNISGSYMVHLFGFLSHKTQGVVNSKVLLEYLAASNCPETYKMMAAVGII